MQEISPVPGVGQAISVRAAKAHLSGLLDLVEAGREVVITSDGNPRRDSCRWKIRSGGARGSHSPERVSTSTPCRHGAAGSPPRKSSAKTATREAGDVFGHRHPYQIARRRTGYRVLPGRRWPGRSQCRLGTGRSLAWSALLAKERNKLISRIAARRPGAFNERVQDKQIILHPLTGVVL